MKRDQSRKSSGSVLPIAISLMLFVTTIGMGLCHLMLSMGAGNEAQTAVNAGALRVGQHVLTVTEQPDAGAQLEQFDDIAWSNGGRSHFTVANINRAMAKSMIVAANYADMQATGFGTPLAKANAEKMENDCLKLCASIKKSLADHRTNFDREFTTFANSNSLRMGTFRCGVKPREEQWEMAYVDADDRNGAGESNIVLDKNVLPGSQKDAFPTITKDGKTYVRGYQNSKLTKLRMVPFRHGGRPALISSTDFNASKRPGAETDVPNAFACSGTAMSQDGQAIQATAMVQTNPQQEFEMRPKDGWIRIVLHKNDVDFFLYGIKAKTDNYGHRPGFTPSIMFPVPIGVAKVTAYCGNEFTPPTVWSCLFPPLCWGDSTPQWNLTQRLRELRPDLSDEQLRAPLKKAWVNLTSGEDQVFYVFLDRDNNITVRPAASADIPKTVRQWAQPDGEGRGYDQKYVPGTPNFSTAKITGIPRCTITTACLVKGGVNWIPSTGYNGCLGQIEHKNTTLCHIVVTPK